MPIKETTNLASLKADGREQTTKTNFGSLRATPIRTKLDKTKLPLKLQGKSSKATE